MVLIYLRNYVESIKDGRSEIRNKVIARFLKEIRFIEQWGTGIKRIIELCKLNGLKDMERVEIPIISFKKVFVLFPMIK
nr:ATP-binding protein [Marinitoga hydrogenitolerans]